MQKLLYVVCFTLALASGSAAVAQEYCPQPPAPMDTKPKVAFEPPTEFWLETRAGDPSQPPLLFVGDSLVGGLSAPHKDDRLAFRVASLLGGRTVTALSLAGRPSGFIADAFDAWSELPSNVTLIVWVGRNNIDNPERVISDIRRIVTHAQAAHFLVLSIPTRNIDQERPGSPQRERVDRLNALLFDAFESNFVQVGGTTNCSDRADTVHFTASGQDKIASEIATAISALGY